MMLGMLAATAASMIGSYMMNRHSEKKAQQNAELQRQWQLEDRAHEEAYNDPQAQLNRFRNAGINPMNSGSIGVGESAVPQAEAPENVDYRNPGEDLANGMIAMSNYDIKDRDLSLRKDQLELDKRKLENEIDKTHSDIEVNKSVKSLNEKLGAKTQQEANAIGETFKKLMTENKYYDEKLQKELEALGIDVKSKKLQYKFDYDTLNDRMENLRASNKLIWKQIDEIGSKIGLNNQMKKYWYTKTKEMNELLANNYPYWQSVSMKNQALKDGIAYKTMIIGYQYTLDTQPVQRMILDYNMKSASYDKWNRSNQAFSSEYQMSDPNTYIKGSLNTIESATSIGSNLGRMGFYLYGIKNMSGGKALIQTSPTHIHLDSPMPPSTIMDIYGQNNYNSLGTSLTVPNGVRR